MAAGRLVARAAVSHGAGLGTSQLLPDTHGCGPPIIRSRCCGPDFAGRRQRWYQPPSEDILGWGVLILFLYEIHLGWKPQS